MPRLQQAVPNSGYFQALWKPATSFVKSACHRAALLLLMAAIVQNAEAQTRAAAAQSLQRSSDAVFHVSSYEALDGEITQADAAFRAASSWVTTHRSGAVLDLGAQAWDVCNAGEGWVLPQAPQYSSGLSIIGVSVQTNQLNLICAIHRSGGPTQISGILSQAFLWQPTVRPAELNSFNMHDFSLNMNGKAAACMDILGLTYVSTFRNITCSGAAGPDHGIRFGDHNHPDEASSFQTFLENLEVEGNAPQGSGAEVTAEMQVGKPHFVVAQGGHHYSHATKAWLIGYGKGSQPCTKTPELAVDIVDEQDTSGTGRISAVRATSQSEGCTGPAWVILYDPIYPIRFGFLFDNWTDSTAYDLQPDAGYEAAILINSSSNVFIHAHPCCGMPVQIRDNGANVWVGTELDSPAHYGFSFDASASPSLMGTNFVWNRQYPGSSAYRFGPDVKSASIAGGNCSNFQDAGGYHQIVLPGGPADPGSALPEGFSISGERPCTKNSKIVPQAVARRKAASSLVFGNQPSSTYTLTLAAKRARMDAGHCERITQAVPATISNHFTAQVTPLATPGDAFTWDTSAAPDGSLMLRVCNRSATPQTLQERTFFVVVQGYDER